MFPIKANLAIVNVILDSLVGYCEPITESRGTKRETETGKLREKHGSVRKKEKNGVRKIDRN